MARKIIEPQSLAAGDSTHEGCTILTKQRQVAVDKGVAAKIVWPLRFPDGVAGDLSDLTNPEIRVRFEDICGNARLLGHMTATVTDAATGLISFDLPSEVYNMAGLYRFHIAVVNSAGVPFFADRGLLSIESGLFGDISQATGPPTLQEIRLHMRDTAIENDLLADVEFDDTEIVAAIARPIQQWNETPPDIARHTCQTFPYRFHWLNATVGELLMTATHHYMRNKMKANAGGLSIDDKAKDRDYIQFAQLYSQEWQRFIITKKSEINLSRCYGSIGSDYGS